MDNMEKQNNAANQEGCASGTCTAEHEIKVEKIADGENVRRRTYVPAVDLVESESDITLIVDVPGVPEGGVDLSIEKNILTLSAVPADGVIAGKKLAYSEYGVGEYRRSFALSEEIDRDHVSATLKDGVLRIKLPKSTPVTKKINVATA